VGWAAVGVLLLALPQLMVLIRLDVRAFNSGAEELLARSRLVRDAAGPDYERDALSRLPPNALNGRTFRLDDLAPSPTRAPDPAAGADVIVGFEFEGADDPRLETAEGPSPPIEDGLLEFTAGRSDRHLVSAGALSIARAEVGEIVIRARSSARTQLALAWHGDEVPRNEWRESVNVDLVGDGRFHIYAIAGSALRRGSGATIRRILLRPSKRPDVDVDLDWVRFVSKRAKYSRQPWGNAYEVVGHELRRALFMHPGQSLDFGVRVPSRSPTLELGLGLLLEELPVEFEVELTAPEGSVTLLREHLEDTSAWSDRRVDLTEWADRDVRLTLRATGSGANVALWSSPVVRGAPLEPFNVIVLLQDTLRADHLSSYGHDLPTSPVLDRRLGRGGVLFRHAVAQATRTRPSVPALMTSLLPTATGVWHLNDVLDDAYLTLAEVLRSQGFTTAALVQNSNAGPSAGLHQGFSQLIDAPELGKAPERVLGARLERWLEAHRDRNFFLYLHVLDPHGPYEPPAPFDEWYRRRGEGGTPVAFDYRMDPAGLEGTTLEGRRLRYDGEIRRNDALLDDMFGMLEKNGIAGHTLVILTSDHGEYLGERGMWSHHPPGLMQAVHVPLVFIQPRRFGELRVIEPFVQLTDVMPTILELAGVQTQGLVMQGDSLVELLDGSDPSRWRRRLAISEEPSAMTRGQPFVSGSLFFGPWHLISSRALGRRVGGWRPGPAWGLQVFDTSADPRERRSCAGFLADVYVRHRFVSIVRELQRNDLAAWEAWTARTEDVRRLDPEVRERLRALGY
jgi:arylsulfatase A-like enzyme